MKGTGVYGSGDIRFEHRDDPKIVEPTDAVLRSPRHAGGSDLWPYRGLQPIDGPTPMGHKWHEYCGIDEEVGSPVKSIKPGQFVVVSIVSPPVDCNRICRGHTVNECASHGALARCSRLLVAANDHVAHGNRLNRLLASARHQHSRARNCSSHRSRRPPGRG
jgi:threonine dehydrogenase-like Zn-dependent dehydrogenase